MGTPTIRKLAPDEGRTYRDLRLAALTDSPGAFGSTLALEQGRSDAEWAARLAPSDRDLPLVAEIDGEPVGLAWGRIEQAQPDTAHVYQMWVAPEHRRSGAARAMLDAIVDWAATRKLRRVELFVAADNKPAIQLYLGAGFKPLGGPAALCGGSEILAQTMELVLSPPVQLPPAPATLSSGDVTLRFVRITPGDASRGFVPGYHFRIVTRDGSDAGHINFRVGDTEHARWAAGHIGFEVHELDLPHMLHILFNYGGSRHLDAELDGRAIHLERKHDIDFHTATFTTREVYTVREPDGRTWRFDKDHPYAITSFPELVYLLEQAGFADVRTYTSYDARAPEQLDGGRMIISAQAG